jgi:hypothetical protein
MMRTDPIVRREVLLTFLVFLQPRPVGCDEAFSVYGLRKRISDKLGKGGRREKHTYILLLASSSFMPNSLKNDKSCFATPTPEDPAPKKRIF